PLRFKVTTPAELCALSLHDALPIFRAYELQDEGFDTVEANERLGFQADQRDYGIGVQILRELGVRSMRLLSNNPRKLVAIEGYGLTITEWLSLEIPAHAGTEKYLKTKKEKLGHKLSSV